MFLGNFWRHLWSYSQVISPRKYSKKNRMHKGRNFWRNFCCNRIQQMNFQKKAGRSSEQILMVFLKDFPKDFVWNFQRNLWINFLWILKNNNRSISKIISGGNPKKQPWVIQVFERIQKIVCGEINEGICGKLLSKGICGRSIAILIEIIIKNVTIRISGSISWEIKREIYSYVRKEISRETKKNVGKFLKKRLKHFSN